MAIRRDESAHQRGRSSSTLPHPVLGWSTTGPTTTIPTTGTTGISGTSGLSSSRRHGATFALGRYTQTQKGFPPDQSIRSDAATHHLHALADHDEHEGPCEVQRRVFR